MSRHKVIRTDEIESSLFPQRMEINSDNSSNFDGLYNDLSSVESSYIDSDDDKDCNQIDDAQSEPDADICKDPDDDSSDIYEGGDSDDEQNVLQYMEKMKSRQESLACAPSTPPPTSQQIDNEYVPVNEMDIIWHDASYINFIPRFTIPVLRKGKIAPKFDKNSTHFHVFRKLFPRSLLNFIAQCTNERIALDNKKLEKKKKVKSTDGGEILTVLAISLIMGYNSLPWEASYWSDHKSLGNEAIFMALPRDRALYLLSKLYFNPPSKPEDAMKTYYMESIVDCLKMTFQSAYSDSSMQSIDESMTKFKGRSSLKLFMPMKPIKKGIKIWQRSDSFTGYVYDLNIYSGKEITPAEGSTLGERVLTKLCSSIQRSDVALIFDTFFSSERLFRTIDFPAVGTYMTKRINTPKLCEKLGKGQSQCAVNNHGTLAVKWSDTNEVYLMSNCHKDKKRFTTIKQKDGKKKIVSCPEAFMFYNRYMGGVDHCNQNVANYNFDRKSDKWWKKVFFRLLKITVVNSWILYNDLNRKKISKFTYLVYLTEQMIDHGKEESENTYIRKEGQGRPTKRKRTSIALKGGDHLIIEEKTRRRCKGCPLKGKLNSRTKGFCMECRIPLCVSCFAPYHLGTLPNNQ